MPVPLNHLRRDVGAPAPPCGTVASFVIRTRAWFTCGIILIAAFTHDAGGNASVGEYDGLRCSRNPGAKESANNRRFIRFPFRLFLPEPFGTDVALPEHPHPSRGIARQ
jgi:hypothetical protein